MAGTGVRVSGTESVGDLSEATSACRAALEIFTREKYPQQWATSELALGVALLNLGKRTSRPDHKAKYLNEAVSALHAASEVFTQEKFQPQWSNLQNYLC
jgi:hypothetical protein